MNKQEAMEIEKKRERFRKGTTYKCSKCGQVLKGDLDWDEEDIVIKIIPCESCLLKERVKGHNEGYDRGYGLGYEDGK